MIEAQYICMYTKFQMTQIWWHMSVMETGVETSSDCIDPVSKEVPRNIVILNNFYVLMKIVRRKIK